MITIIVAAAGLFSYVGFAAQRAAREYRAAPEEARNFHDARLRVTSVVDKQLSAADLKPYLETIEDPHVVGAFDNALYVASWKNKKLFRIDVTTNQKRLLADELDQVAGVAPAKDKHLVATLHGENRIVVVDVRSGKVTPLARDIGGPSGITPARDGNYYVAAQEDGTVLKLQPDGKTSVVARDLPQPVGLISDNDNIITVTLKGDPARSVTVIADNGKQSVPVPGLTGAAGIFRDDERNTLLTAQVNGRGALIAWPRGRQATPILVSDSPELSGPVSDGRGVYVAAPERNLVYRIEL